MVPIKDGTFSVALNPRGSSVAFSNSQMRWWVVATKVKVVWGQHLVEELVLEVDFMLEVEESLELVARPEDEEEERKG